MNEIIRVVTTLTAKIDSSKRMDRRVALIVHVHKAHHTFIGNVGFEHCMRTDPISTLTCNRTLSQLVAKLYLELGSENIFLTCQTRDIELSTFLFGDLGCKGGLGKDKAKLFDILQLLFKLLKSINRETSCRDRYLAAGFDFYREVIS